MIRFLQQLRDFVLALPSGSDKRSAPPVRALRHRCFMSPGPPWYAAQCRLAAGHSGDCDFGTVEEARRAWDECTGRVGEEIDRTGGVILFRREDADRAAIPGPRKTEERSRICNMRWSNVTVTLGDMDFIHCRFFNCKLIDDGPFSMEKCFIDSCTIQTKEQQRETTTSRPLSVR